MYLLFKLNPNKAKKRFNDKFLLDFSIYRKYLFRAGVYGDSFLSK